MLSCFLYKTMSIQSLETMGRIHDKDLYKKHMSSSSFQTFGM